MQFNLKNFIKGLPKAELHLHLEGTLEPELKLALAQKNHIDIGQQTIEEVKASYQFDSLSSFLAVYYPAMNVLQDESDFYALAMYYLQRATQDNVKYVELFFDPQAHTSRGIAFETILNGYYKATQDGKKLGIESQLVMCFLRDFSAESAMETFQQALPYKDKILAIGLDSDERDNPPAKFAEVFALAKAEGFYISMHCDIDQKNSIEHIRQALMDIGVDRLDHGTNIVEDETLVEYVRQHKIGLTCCPVSNSFVVNNMKGDEIISLLHKGVKVTINSDDPAYFQSYIADDMYALASHYHLSLKDIVQLTKNAFEIARIAEDKKSLYLKQVDDYVKQWTA